MSEKIGCLGIFFLLPFYALFAKDEDTGKSDPFYSLVFILVYFLYFFLVLFLGSLSYFLSLSLLLTASFYYVLGGDFLVLSLIAIFIVLFGSYKAKGYDKSAQPTLTSGYKILHNELVTEFKKIL